MDLLCHLLLESKRSADDACYPCPRLSHNSLTVSSCEALIVGPLLRHSSMQEGLDAVRLWCLSSIRPFVRQIGLDSIE